MLILFLAHSAAALMFLFIGLLQVASALDNGVARTPPLGWNTWKTCGEETCGHDVCNEREVKAAAEAMLSNGMHDLGYNYINLDDCVCCPPPPHPSTPLPQNT